MCVCVNCWLDCGPLIQQATCYNSASSLQENEIYMAISQQPEATVTAGVYANSDVCAQVNESSLLDEVVPGKMTSIYVSSKHNDLVLSDLLRAMRSLPVIMAAQG